MRKVGKKIKETQTLGNNIVKIRNSRITHCDIGKKSEVGKIVLQIETLKSIFQNSVEILELLSLKYFEYNGLVDQEMISVHGFDNFVIKNIWINSDSNTDLDLFFNTLYFDFIENIESGSYSK